MNEQYYRELDPEKRWQILQNEPESEEKRRAQELYLLRHRDEKSGERNPEQDHYLWFLLSLGISGSRRPFFVKSEARRVLRDLRKLEGIDKDTNGEEPISLQDDVLFQMEIKNTARRLFAVSSHDGWGRKLLGFGQPKEEMRLADQCTDAWRLIYGAPDYLNLEEELRPISEMIKEAYLEVDDQAAERLEAMDRKMRPNRKK